MAAPSLPTNKKHQRMLIVGAAAMGLLLVLYLRSRSSAASSGASSTDVSSAAAAAAQAQAQQDAALYGTSTPSTFADNGANASALGDAVTNGLQGVQQALTQLQTQQTAAPTSSPAPAAPAPLTITVNTPGQPAANPATTSSPGSSNKKTVGTTLPGGAIVAPSGHNKPATKAGYTTVGTGGGGWIYVKNAKPPVNPSGNKNKQPGKTSNRRKGP